MCFISKMPAGAVPEYAMAEAAPVPWLLNVAEKLNIPAANKL
jgi:hypothetical protein